MAWLEGDAQRELEIEAPLDDVADYFANPEQFEDCVDDLESLESVGDAQWHFKLEEMSAKGISFQGEYIVAYDRRGDEVVWNPAGEETNMKSEGRARLEDLGSGCTRVRYEQKMSVQLPIPGFMTGVFRPIVNREVSKAIESLLDCSKSKLERA